MAIGMLALSRSAGAQLDGFALDRFSPPERGSDWLVGDSLDLRGDQRWALGIVSDWIQSPLVVYDENGDRVGSLVDSQLYTHLGASVVLVDRVRLAANLPVLLVNGSDGALGSGLSSVRRGANVGDARVSVDVRLLGGYEDALTVAGGVQVYLPTGDPDAYSGDGSVRVSPRVAMAGRLGNVAYAGRTGVEIRTADKNFAGQQLGSEWQFAASAGVWFLDDRLLVGPEVWGSTTIGADGSFFDKDTTPMQSLLGAHLGLADWNVGLGAGPGLNQGLGVAEWLAVGSAEWAPEYREPPPPVRTATPLPPADIDGDGIADTEDACPTDAGPASDLAERHGCPLPEDSDGDGVFDAEDACPVVVGVASRDPKLHGCPPPDADGDEILDAEDACPKQAGVASENPERHGCPVPPDADKDGILDPEDACPTRAGAAHPNPDRHGCPRVEITEDQVRVLERVEFNSGKATLTAEGTLVLQDVLRVLKEHSEIQRMRVEGHTDSRGSFAFNQRLSEQRAAAVVAWLIEQGIDARRLVSKGFGPSRPIDSNDTAEGRQNNRRVEFHIEESSDGSKEPPGEPQSRPWLQLRMPRWVVLK